MQVNSISSNQNFGVRIRGDFSEMAKTARAMVNGLSDSQIAKIERSLQSFLPENMTFFAIKPRIVNGKKSSGALYAISENDICKAVLIKSAPEKILPYKYAFAAKRLARGDYSPETHSRNVLEWMA